ncbi:MAG: 50S ribosomal protein L19 [Phycisphaerales bacterium]
MDTQKLIESVSGQPAVEVPQMDIGDTVNVHCKIVEGDKERIQIFQGVLISRKGRGSSEMLTVRRIVDNQGVERIFPVLSPRVAKYEVVRKAGVRRSKLYFLRERVGKKRRLRDQRRGLASAAAPESASAES